MVKASKEDSILKWLTKYDSNLILFHHRFPTSTINVKRAAHPFSTKDYFGDTQYVMVHNGWITNDDKLFDDHLDNLGIEYQSWLDDGTFNDSEALLWDLALTLEGKQDSLKARGAIAFIMLKLHTGKLEKMYFGRNSSSPLNMRRTDEGVWLSSEGEGESIEQQTLYTYNYALKRLTKKPFDILASSTYYNSGYTNNSYAASHGYSTTNDWSDSDNWYGNKNSAPIVRSELCDMCDGYMRTISEGQHTWSVCNNCEYAEYSSDINDLGAGDLEDNDWVSGLENDDDEDYDPEGGWQPHSDWADRVGGKLGKYLNIGNKTVIIGKEEPDEITTEPEFDERVMPSKTEIERLVLDFLTRADGVFNVAYEQMEQEYQELLEYEPDNDALGKLWQRHQELLYEASMELLTKDPDYENEKSVSSIWEAICTP